MQDSSARISEKVRSTQQAPTPSYVVDIVGLSKSFRRHTRGRKGYTTLKSSLLGLFQRAGSMSGAGPENITHAIKDLTLRIPKGASVGLIGRNGSGKSTFLKLITGIYKPDRGSLAVHGRVSALIELGAGFHPDFTGRENLMLAGVMHGLSRDEILRRFDEIVRFAELEHVIDDPVRTYSSGMFMRLGFSIAIHTDPDILLVDEVLAVGDAGFVAKCKDRIAELRKQGKTLVLVTHDLDAVERWCDEVVWLNNGEVKDRGHPRRVIDAYRQFIERGEEAEILREEVSLDASVAPSHSASPSEATQPARWGSREVEIVSVEICGNEGTPKRVFHPDDSMRIRISYNVHTPQEEIVFGVGINRADGLVVFGTNTLIERITLPRLISSGTVECVVERVGLVDGAYSLDVAVHRDDGYPFDFHKDTLNFSARSDTSRAGIVSPPHRWLLNGEECSCSG
jgi:ABC-type polysaccharide/polyol phosphate transport system ATPase subunit